MPAPVHAPIVPLPELTRWSVALGRLATQPLEFCPDLPRIAARFEAWWNHAALDRPILMATANADPARPITRRLDLLATPAAWLDAKLADLRQTARVGDTLPAVRVDFGAVMLGGLLGGLTQFGSDTTWTEAFIAEDWSNAPAWSIREDHPWWRLLRALLGRAAEDARGRYLVMTPDLGGAADVLLNLRGAAALCGDVIEQPGRIAGAVEALYPAWRQGFIECYRQTVERGAGVVHWLGLWSSRPYVIPACDFCFMIGPRAFERLFLPDIARQAATVGRAVFHLDGPGAARHIDALLEVPEIQAIQFTPGEGTPSALAWVEMFRKIQGKGRSVLVIAPPEEVRELCRQLRPEGLAILTGERDPARLGNLYEAFCRQAGGAGCH